jgi:hypothetical protein
VQNEKEIEAIEEKQCFVNTACECNPEYNRRRERSTCQESKSTNKVQPIQKLCNGYEDEREVPVKNLSPLTKYSRYRNFAMDMKIVLE